MLLLPARLDPQVALAVVGAAVGATHGVVGIGRGQVGELGAGGGADARAGRDGRGRGARVAGGVGGQRGGGGQGGRGSGAGGGLAQSVQLTSNIGTAG